MIVKTAATLANGINKFRIINKNDKGITFALTLFRF